MKHSIAKLVERVRSLIEAGKPADAQQLIEAQMSHNEIHSALRKALKGRFPNSWIWVRDVFEESVVWDDDGLQDDTQAQCHIYRASYSIDESGAVTLGEPEEVHAHTVYEPVAAATSLPATPVSQPFGVQILESDVVELVEAAIGPDGTVPVKIIRPGWGATGYYPQEVLKRDGPAVFTKGLHMYWNHPTEREDKERPERDLNDLAAVLVEDARWDDNGPKGPGLYSRAKPLNGYGSSIEDMAEHIGLSILGYGRGRDGEADGLKGFIVEELTGARSVDFVTKAGAGGEILTLFEAARLRGSASLSNHPSQPGGQQMADKTKAGAERPLTESAGKTEGGQGGDSGQDTPLAEALQLKVTGLRTENEALRTQLKEAQGREAELMLECKRLEEKVATRDAQDFVRKLGQAADVPAFLLERQVQEIPTALKMKDGKLDEEAFRPLVEKRIREDMEFWARSTGSGSVHGMGAGGSTDISIEEAERLLDAEMRRGGLDERAARVATLGRRV